MTMIQNFMNQLLLNIDKSQTTILKKELKKISHLDITNFNDLDQGQKNILLKSLDKLFNNNFKLLHRDVENLFNKDPSFTEYFKLLRFPINNDFSLFWKHIQLVDNLHNDLNQKKFNDLKKFLTDFGTFKIQDKTLDDFWEEANNGENLEILPQAIFALSLYSILSHLDILTHRLLFKGIEPICLGWLLQKKLNPKNFQYKDGTFTKTSKHKAVWTNPSRSLLTLMATFSALKLADEKPSTCHGLNFSNYLLNYTDKKDNFIRKANEGFPISYKDFIWLLSKKVERNDIQTAVSEEITQETINIMLNGKSDYIGNNLFPLWVIYRFFQNDCENRPKNTAYMHGIYYDFWEVFANFYKKEHSNLILEKWPNDLKELAQ